jgi:hypothetical protein
MQLPMNTSAVESSGGGRFNFAGIAPVPRGFFAGGILYM